MMYILILLLSLAPPIHAKSARTVELADGDIAQIHVETGFSTILKFDSRPERGLVGDQDGFKVEYLKNVVAIKPLVMSGRTNLFLFTKDGQFNFQLIAGRGRHDNVVYVKPKPEKIAPSQPAHGQKSSLPIEALRTKKINKSAALGSARITIESVAAPPSGSTLIVRFLIRDQKSGKEALNPKAVTIAQGESKVRTENIYLETREVAPNILEVTGLLMIRTQGLMPRKPIRLSYVINAAEKQELSVTFTP